MTRGGNKKDHPGFLAVTAVATTAGERWLHTPAVIKRDGKMANNNDGGAGSARLDICQRKYRAKYREYRKFANGALGIEGDKSGIGRSV